MKQMARVWCSRGALLALLVGVLTACASAVPSQAAAPGAQACPSQDFKVYLQRFADPVDDQVRRHYTADPLEYEVPTHTIRDDTDGLPAVQISRQQGSARLARFSYRYLAEFDLFVPALALGNPDSLEGMRAGTFTAPTQIQPGTGGSRLVTFGTEYESDTYTFARREGCWVLTRATNLRD